MDAFVWSFNQKYGIVARPHFDVSYLRARTGEVPRTVFSPIGRTRVSNIDCTYEPVSGHSRFRKMSTVRRNHATQPEVHLLAITTHARAPRRHKQDNLGNNPADPRTRDLVAPNKAQPCGEGTPERAGEWERVCEEKKLHERERWTSASKSRLQHERDARPMLKQTFEAEYRVRARRPFPQRWVSARHHSFICSSIQAISFSSCPVIDKCIFPATRNVERCAR